MIWTVVGGLMLLVSSLTIQHDGQAVKIVQTPFSNERDVVEVTKDILPESTPLTPKQRLKCDQAEEKIKDWGRRLRLNMWTIGLICGSPVEEAREAKERGLEFQGATQTANEDYVALIWINPDGSEPVELVVIHELTHILLTDYRIAYSKDTDERVTRVLARNIFNARYSSKEVVEGSKP